MAKILEYDAQVNTLNAEKNLDSLDNKMEDVGKTAEKTGEKMEEAAQKPVEATKKAKGGFKGIGEQLGQLGGPIGSVISGIKGVIQVFNILIMNPIGLIIAAIATALITLYKAFTSTKAGAEQVEQIMAGLGAVIDVLRDRVLAIGEAFGKLFSGDFKGAIKGITSAFSGMGEEMAKEYNEAAKLKKELQAITDQERELKVARAEQNKVIAEAKLKINDETLSIQERKKALEQVRQAEVKLAKDQEALARRKYEAIKAQNALSDSSKEALDAEAAAYEELMAKQVESLGKQKELFDQEKALNDKIKAERKAKYDEMIRNQQTAQKFMDDLRIEQIENELIREQEKLKLQFDAREKELNELKISAAKKRALLKELNDLEKKQLKDLEDKYNKSEEEKKKAADQKKKDDDKKALDEAFAKEQEAIQRKADQEKLDAYNTITKQEDLNKKLAEIEAQRIQDQIASMEKAGKDTTAIRLKIAEDQNKAEVDAALKAAEEKKKIDDEALKAKEANIAAISGALKNLTSLVGEETGAGKALAVASAIIDTYTGATKAFAQGGIFGYIGAAGVIASGMANVRKILETKVEGDKGGSAPSMNSIGPSVGIIGGSIDSGSQAAGALNKAMKTPPKAYVVGQDVTSQQSLDRKIAQNATI